MYGIQNDEHFSFSEIERTVSSSHNSSVAFGVSGPQCYQDAEVNE